MRSAPVRSLINRKRDLDNVGLGSRHAVPVGTLFVVAQSSVTDPLISRLNYRLRSKPFNPVVGAGSLGRADAPNIFTTNSVTHPFTGTALSTTSKMLTNVSTRRSLIIDNGPRR